MDGVLYVNDSKATNVSAAARGIESFFAGVHLILGGSLKGGGFSELREPVAERCRACYLIGEAADRLAADLGDSGVPLHAAATSRRAVEAARAAAEPGEVVLLSPACASYDQFRDYEERGERFRSARLACMNRARGVEESPDGCARRPQATGRVLDPLHGDALPARVRGGHGLLGELGGVAAERPRRPVLLPQALPDVRRDRAWWSCTSSRGTA